MKFQKKKDLKLRKAFSKYEMKQIFSKYLFIQRGKSSELGENFICASGGVASTFDTQTLPKSQKRKIEEKVLTTLRYDEKVKATGKIYNAQAEHLWTFNNDGKIIDFQQYIDAKKLADAEK